MFGRQGLQTPARLRARIVILRPRQFGSGLTWRRAQTQTGWSIKTLGCARFTSETSRAIEIFARGGTLPSIATETSRSIGRETSMLIAIAILPSFVLATAWRSIARETSRLIVGAILRLTITSAAPRLAANSMRSSAITTESGTIVVGGATITIGSSL